MPLALSKKTFKVVLESDKNKPEGQQPYFEFRFLSGKEWGKIAEIADSIEQSTTGTEAIDKLFKVLTFGLVGWGHMVDPENGKLIEFGIDRLPELLVINEANELLERFKNKQLGTDVQKEAESQ